MQQFTKTERAIAGAVLVVCIGYCAGLLPNLLPTVLMFNGYGLPGAFVTLVNWTFGLAIYVAIGDAVLSGYMRIRA